MTFNIYGFSVSLAAAALIAAAVSGCSCYDEQTSRAERAALSVELFDRSDDVNRFDTYDTEALKEWIQKNFGDKNNADIEFVMVPRKSETDELNKFIASGKGPDIAFTYNPYYFGSYALSGQLTELTGLLDNCGSELKAFAGESLLDKGRAGGGLYAIPAKRMFTGKYTSYIRKDWLDALSLPVPKTTEELIYTLRRFREIGDDVIPFSSQYGNSGAIKLFSQNYCMDSPNDRVGYFSDDRYKNSLRLLNSLYNEGILGSGYSTDTSSTEHFSRISEGRVGFFVDSISNVSFRRIVSINNMIKQKDPNAEYIACDAISSSGGAHFKEVNGENGMYIFIPSYSKNAELAMKYLNWMARPEVLRELQQLIAGNGDIHSTDYFDISIIVNGYFADTKQESLEYEAASYGAYADLFRSACFISETDGFNHDGQPEEIALNGNSDLTAKLIDKYVARCISAPTGEFDAVYAKAAAEFLAERGRIKTQIEF